MIMEPYGYVWKWGIFPMIAMNSNGNDQQNHWVFRV